MHLEPHCCQVGYHGVEVVVVTFGCVRVLVLVVLLLRWQLVIVDALQCIQMVMVVPPRCHGGGGVVVAVVMVMEMS